MRLRARSAVPDLPEGVADHPFILWYAALRGMRAARCVKEDIYLDDLGGKRFSIGVDPDATPVIGVLEDDAAPLMSLRWTAAAFVREFRGRDWIALSCRDARAPGALEMNAVPLRLWFPISRGMFAAWDDSRPSRVKLRAVSATEEGLVPLERGPLAELPLTFKGAWPALNGADR